MQQIYRSTTMPKRDFTKVAKQLYWNNTSTWCSPVNLLHIFRTPFPRDTSGWLLLNLVESNFGKASKILIWISFLIQRMQIRFKLKLLGIWNNRCIKVKFYVNLSESYRVLCIIFCHIDKIYIFKINWVLVIRN